MRKTYLLLIALLTLCCGLTSAQQAPADAGVYYLYNTESGQFLSRGSDWGTRAVTNPVGVAWQVTVAEGQYQLRMYDLVKAGNTKGLSDNCFTDSGDAVNFTLEGDANGYFLKNGETYLTAPATAGHVNFTETPSTWQFLSKEDFSAKLAEIAATQDAAVAAAAGIDLNGATFADAVSDTESWLSSTTVDPTPTKTSWNVQGVPSRGGNQNNVDCGFEIFQGGCSFSKTISGLMPGIYKVTVKGLKRMGTNGNCYTIGKTEGYVNSDAYFSANGNIVQIADWASACTDAGNPNGPGAAKDIWDAGQGYTRDVFCYVGNDGVLNMKGASEAYWGNSWFLFGGVEYTYYIRFTAEDVAALLATVPTDPMDADVKAALDAAVANGASDMEAYKALIQAISAAKASAAQYAEVKAALDAADAAAANLDEKGAAQYEKYIKWAKDDYENGTCNFNEESGNGIYTAIREALNFGLCAQTTKGSDLTGLIVNPNFDNNTLTGWDNNGFKTSTGNADITNAGFANTPLVEQWVWNAGLSDISLSQELTGLGKGVYTLTAHVMATRQDHTDWDIEGVTLFANDQEVAVSAADYYSVEFELPYTQNSVTIGVKTNGTNANWVVVDEFSLKLKHIVVDTPEDYVMSFENIIPSERVVPSGSFGIATLQDVDGNDSPWQNLKSGESWTAGAVVNYATGCEFGKDKATIPAAGSDDENNQGLAVVCSWGSTANYGLQTGLAEGYYKLSTAVYNTYGTSEVAKNLFGFIAEDGTEYLSTAKTYPVDQWTPDQVLFKVNDYTLGHVSVGYTAKNEGSGNTAHLIYDYVNVEKITAQEFFATSLQAIFENIEATLADIAAKEGTGVFMYKEGSLATLEAALTEVMTLQGGGATDEEWEAAYNNLVAALNPEINEPVAGQLYTIKNANADVYMNVTNGVTVETTPSYFTFVATDNGYQLQSGENFVGMKGTDNWSMSNTAADSWTITYLGEGKYTLKGAKGLIGTDNLAPGSACYGDKNVDKNGAWIIALPAPAELPMEYNYNEGQTAVTFTVTPTQEGTYIFYFFNDDEEPMGMVENGTATIAAAPGQFNEQGIAHFLVTFREYDENMTLVAENGVEVDLLDPNNVPAELPMDYSYSEDLTTVTFTVTPTQEGTTIFYFFDDDEEPMGMVENADGTVTIAAAPGQFNEQGIAHFLVTFREYDENMTLVAENGTEVDLLQQVAAEATFYQPTELVVGNTYEAGIREEGYYYYTFTPTTDGCVTLNPNSEIYNIMVTTGNFMMNAEEDEDMDEAVEVETYSIAVETDDEEDEIDEEFGWGWGSTLSKTAWNVKAGETYYVMMLGGMEGTTFTVEWSDEPYVPTYELGHDKNPINLNENNNTWTWVSADQEGNHTRDDMEFGYEYYTWTAEASGFILLQHAGSCDHFHVGEGGLYDDWKYYEGPAANVIMQPTPYGEVSTVENWKDNTSYSVVEVEAGETYYIATDTPAFGFIYNEAYSEVVLTLTYFATLEELYAALNGEDGINSIDADGNKVIYNLGGTRIQKAVKGVNIINGKKVMVKK